jgi:hypothetical protein
MRRLAVVVAVCSIHVGAVIAQKPEGLPKPGPEHQRLAAFVGNWTIEGDMKPGPMGAGGKMTGTDRIDWVPGNFFIQRLYQGKSPMGEMQGLEILGYDAARKVYTFNSFDSLGMRGSGTLTVKGNTWTSTGTATMGTAVIHDRCTLDFGAGATTLTVKCDMSTDGKSWTPTFEGKATKTK